MSIVSLLVALILIALFFWVLNQFAIPEPIKKVIYVVAVVVIVLWLLQAFLGYNTFPEIRLR